MRVKDGFLVGFLLILAFLLGGADSGGCGGNLFENLADDSTPEAKLEAAKIDLNNKNYAGAITTLAELCGLDPSDPTSSTPTCDAKTQSLLASAYSGLAGLDAINLIKIASTGNISSFGSFSTLLPAPTSANKTAMNNALTLLSGISSRTAGQNLQMAVVAAADLVVTAGVDLTSGFDTTTGQPNQVPTLTQVDNAETNFGTVTRVSSDLNLITQGVNGSGLVNEDLTNDINAIKAGLDTDFSGTVLASELQAYLANL